MCLLHKWTKWEQYEETGTRTPIGILTPRDIRGKEFRYSETRQRRHCLKCNKMEESRKSLRC